MKPWRKADGQELWRHERFTSIFCIIQHLATGILLTLKGKQGFGGKNPTSLKCASLESLGSSGKSCLSAQAGASKQMAQLLRCQRSAQLKGPHFVLFLTVGLFTRSSFFLPLPIFQVEIIVLILQGCDEIIYLANLCKMPDTQGLVGTCQCIFLPNLNPLQSKELQTFIYQVCP